MATRHVLDPILESKVVEIEPEELLEPESETEVEKKTRIQRLRLRLSEYGNRVLGSIRHFLVTFQETLSGIGTAIAGSVIALPAIIVVRGVSVLTDDFVQIVKPLLLSFFRAIFDLLTRIIWPFHEVFTSFNKQVLFPSIKRIREDDTAALAALVVLIVVVVAVYVVATVVL